MKNELRVGNWVTYENHRLHIYFDNVDKWLGYFRDMYGNSIEIHKRTSTEISGRITDRRVYNKLRKKYK